MNMHVSMHAPAEPAHVRAGMCVAARRPTHATAVLTRLQLCWLNTHLALPQVRA